MKLNAVLCVWNEEDIIESTVKHLFAQGCSNVFIVDNDSTDKTVPIAINAGAKLAAKFRTKDFDEDQKVTYLNATVKYINDNISDDKIWWLYVDADEFPHIEGMLLIEYINLLDNTIRAIHGHHFNHIPTHQPYCVQGYHPADFQPLCLKSPTTKVPLLRYDKGKKHLFSIGGAHDFITHDEVIPVVHDILQIHHFQYRNPEYTVKRSKILAENRNEWMKKFAKQINQSDTAAYENRYNAVFTIYNENKNRVLKTKSLCYDFKKIARWYDVNTETEKISSQYDEIICNAVFHFFMKEYDIALCRFKDAFDICNNDETRLWLLMKIAECFSFSDIESAQILLSDIQSSNNSEILAYIENDFGYIRNAKKGTDESDIIGKIAFYRSVFPDTIEKRQYEMMASAEKTLFRF